MSSTLWFTTRSNSVLRHALTADDRAACNKRIRPDLKPVYVDGIVTGHSHTGKVASELPEYAELCPRCQATVAAEEYVKRDRFEDWGQGGTVLEIIDNADSISLQVSLNGPSATLEAEVRIRPEDLDRLERRIRQIREKRVI